MLTPPSTCGCGNALGVRDQHRLQLDSGLVAGERSVEAGGFAVGLAVVGMVQAAWWYGTWVRATLSRADR